MNCTGCGKPIGDVNQHGQDIAAGNYDNYCWNNWRGRHLDDETLRRRRLEEALDRPAGYYDWPKADQNAHRLRERMISLQEDRRYALADLAVAQGAGDDLTAILQLVEEINQQIAATQREISAPGGAGRTAA